MSNTQRIAEINPGPPAETNPGSYNDKNNWYEYLQLLFILGSLCFSDGKLVWISLKIIKDILMKQFSRLFLRSFPRLNSPLLQAKPQMVKVGLATLGLTFSTWLTSSKYFSEELQIIETEDNLKEGEVREVQVGPKP